MEEKTAAPEHAQVAAPTAAPATPATATAPAPQSGQPVHAPVMDVVSPAGQVAVKPEPSAEKTGREDKPETTPKKADKAKPPKPTTPKKESSDVGGAIFATVVIVLSLAAMATYAFIKTQR